MITLCHPWGDIRLSQMIADVMLKKERLKIVIIGHVDHGKSTLIGRLLLDTDSLPKERIAEIRRISKELGKNAELAFLTDQLKEERERSITIDTTQTFFKTRKRDYVIIDAPGHVEFIKNMITGATQADAAVLIIDVNEGVMEQTRRHAYLIKMLGIDKIIVVFNKMDLAGYEEEKFIKVKNELLNFLDKLRMSIFYAIPVSAKEGDNISNKSPKMGWHRGPSFLKALDSLILKERLKERPLRFPVQDVYQMGGKNLLVGRVESGTIKQNQKVVVLPEGSESEIRAIKVFRGDKLSAEKGESIGVILKEDTNVQRGFLISERKNKAVLTDNFRANVFWMSKEPLEINKAMRLKCATQEAGCRAEKIEKRINSSTLQVIEENAKELKLNEAGVVIFKLDKQIVVEKFSFIEELGRFVIEREHNLQGAGIVTNVVA